MAPVLHWLKLMLLLSELLLRPALSSWVSRMNPCDVIVSNVTDDIFFNCFHRGLKEVPVEITENVTRLCLADNRIKNVSAHAFSSLHNLTHLDLNWINKKYEAYFPEGTFSNLSKLVELKLSGNSIMEVPVNLPTGLNKLYLENNKIFRLTTKSFAKLNNLTEIYLSKNCFYWNPCYKAYEIQDGSFWHLNSLHTLDLSRNNLTYVPRTLPPTIKTLKLSSNAIHYISEDDFRDLTRLRLLNLQGNCPRCMNAPYPCVPCPNVSLEIHPQAFSRLKYLEMLHLAGNSLQVIHSSWFKNMTNLKKLFLSFNLLASVFVKGGFLGNLPNLENIDLSYNFDLKAYPLTIKLSDDFSKLVSLKYFHMEGYVFKEIQEETLTPLRKLPNLTILNLGVNFIVNINSGVFKSFPNVKVIYLSENRLYPETVNSYSSNGISTAPQRANPLFQKPPQTAPPGHHDHLLVKKECFETGRVLDLSCNNIFFISPQQFEGYGNISCLNLSKNGFAAALNGTEFSSLPDLKYLDLSFNKIDLAYDHAFQELRKLEVLDLSYNTHYFRVHGVTLSFNFLNNLPALKVLYLHSNYIATLTSKELNSSSLRVLNFANNRLNILWKRRDKTYHRLFRNLVNLKYLDISFNNIENLPSEVYGNFPQTIVELRLSNNLLTKFMWEKLGLLPQLSVLDLSHNFLSHVSANLSAVTKTLRYLKLSYNKISCLSIGFLKDAYSLKKLDLGHNRLTIINESTFQSRPDNYLKELLLEGNPFHCTCDILEFILWLVNNDDVRIPYLATKLTCGMPQEKKGQKVIQFDIKECVDDEVAFLIYFVSTVSVLFFMVVPIAIHLFFWDASYVIRYWIAKIRGHRYHRLTEYLYDAFVVYDTEDPLVTDWVMNHLRVQLEECAERFFPICLEERDWTPGTPVIDSLAESIRQSRKTIFVLTEGYVQSGSFRMALYLAHQRLLDHNADVIVLVLLEPVLQHSRFLRLRRSLCGNSILEWPKNPTAEYWFWQCLRNVIRVDNQVMYSKHYSSYFSTK